MNGSGCIGRLCGTPYYEEPMRLSFTLGIRLPQWCVLTLADVRLTSNMCASVCACGRGWLDSSAVHLLIKLELAGNDGRFAHDEIKPRDQF